MEEEMLGVVWIVVLVGVSFTIYFLPSWISATHRSRPPLELVIKTSRDPITNIH